MSLWICLKWPDNADPADRATALERLALVMLQYTPRVGCFRHDSVVLEISASLSLFKGVRRLCRQVSRMAQSVVPAVRMGLAPSATGSWLLAGPYAARRRVMRSARLARALDDLPLRCLPETEAHLRWLEGIGCHHLGELRALPRQGLKQRTSPILVHTLDAAYAHVNEALSWFNPPDRFRLANQPDFHLERDEAIQAAAQPLLQALCGWLQHRQQALHDFVLVLHHEKGRHACPPTSVDLRFSDATWQLEAFNLLLRERLRPLTLKRAVVKLELIAGAPHPRAPVSETLFPDPSRYAQEESRLLDLLATRLGSASIRRPRPLPHHLPERANTWAAELLALPPNTLPASVGRNARPFWLLPCPQRLNVQQERPFHQGRPLRLVQGPERIETDWFNGAHQRRDYFVAQDPDGARYWVYREREIGTGWFLHGLFA